MKSQLISEVNNHQLASTYRWTSGREPFSPFAANVRRKCVINVRTRCCARGADEEEGRFSHVRILQRCQQAGIVIDRRSTSRLRPARFPLFGVQSIRSRSCCVIVVPRISKSVEDAPPPTRLTRWRTFGASYVLLDALGHEDTWKTRGLLSAATFAARTPTRDFYI